MLANVTFTAVFEQVPDEEGGGYHAYVEELPGAISQGDTLEEARENLHDAIQMIVEANRQLAAEASRGRPVIREPIAIRAA